MVIVLTTIMLKLEAVCISMRCLSQKCAAFTKFEKKQGNKQTP